MIGGGNSSGLLEMHGVEGTKLLVISKVKGVILVMGGCVGGSEKPRGCIGIAGVIYVGIEIAMSYQLRQEYYWLLFLLEHGKRS